MKHARLFLSAIVLAVAIAALRSNRSSRNRLTRRRIAADPVYEVLRTTSRSSSTASSTTRPGRRRPLIGPLVNNRDGSPSPLKSEAKVLYDDKFIYFASRFVDDNIWATFKKSATSTSGPRKWSRCSSRRIPPRSNYIELEVNPLGTMIDIYLLDIRVPLHYESWNSEKLQWAIQVDGTVDGKPGDKEWTCEMAFRSKTS